MLVDLDGNYLTNDMACVNEASAGAVFTEVELRNASYATINTNHACSLRFRMN